MILLLHSIGLIIAFNLAHDHFPRPAGVVEVCDDSLPPVPYGTDDMDTFPEPFANTTSPRTVQPSLSAEAGFREALENMKEKVTNLRGKPSKIPVPRQNLFFYQCVL